jgi:hypothetical protein
MTYKSWVGLALAFCAVACGKNEAPVGGAPSTATAPPAPADCGHAACGDSFFVDALVRDGCATAARCEVSLKLTATGAFHVNDQYPYRFKAEATPAVEFLGTDPAGKNVFSRQGGDWTQTDAKSGVLTVHWTPTAAGAGTLSGVFKLSVCSEQNCLIEQPQLRVPIHSS